MIHQTAPQVVRHRTIMIVTGETSGDMHGARLAEALRRLAPDLSFCGMGGEAMARAGVEILFPAETVAVVGIVEVLRHLGAIRRGFVTLRRALEKRRPDVLVCIDLPDFNMRLARYAARCNIPVCYYICPQVWAWRPNRARHLAGMVDRLAVILPFEEPFYRGYGIPVEYVGHPLLDDPQLSEARGCQPPTEPLVGILPGSRIGEVRRMLPIFLAAARLVHEKRPDTRFLLIQAPGIDRAVLDGAGLAAANLPITVEHHQRHRAMAACRAVLAASGTVTLELALLGVPAVVAYRTHPLTYAIGRRLVSVSFISLVNLIADRMVVPEFLQDEAHPPVLADRLLALLDDTLARSRQIEGYRKVRAKLGSSGASERVARIVIDMLKER